MSKSVDLPAKTNLFQIGSDLPFSTAAIIPSTYLIYKPIPVGGNVAKESADIQPVSDVPSTSKPRNEPKKSGDGPSSQPFIISMEIPETDESEPPTAVPQCEKCGLVCEGFPQLISHTKKCSDSKLFNCENCPESFNHEVNFRLHSAIHENVGETFTCPQCQKTFNRSAAFRCHLALHRVDESISCDQCQEEFAFNSQLKRHVLTAHMKQLNQVNYCKICAAVCSTFEELRKHMETHRKIREILKTTKRGKVKKLFTVHACKVCQKVFTRRSALERHEIIHTGQRPHVCNICNMSFTQTGALQYHMARHMPEKPYKCQLCGMGFTQRGNLRTHVRRCHPTNYDKKLVYPCPACPCIFKRVQVLNQHVTRLHPQVYPVDKPNPPKDKENRSDHAAGTSGKSSDLVETAMCNSGIVQKQLNSEQSSGAEPPNLRLIYKPVKPQEQADFEAHCNYVGDGIVHSKLTDIAITYVDGKRFLVCPVTECGKLFKKPSDMVRHHRIHTNTRPYKCHLCPQSFKTKHVLVSHMRHHSGIKSVQCQLCFKFLSSETSLKHHMKIHLGNDQVTCQRCSKTFRSSGSFAAHEKRCQTYGELKTLGKTNQPVPDVSRLSKKELMILAKVLPDVKLADPIKLAAAREPTTTKRREKVYTCPMCPARFAYASHHSQHIRTHTRELRFKCYICQKGFIRLDQLHKHLIVHTGVKKPYSCAQCHQSFSTQQSRDRHRFVHEDSKPFACPYCGQSFKQGRQCRLHIKTHRFSEVVKSYRKKFADEQRKNQPSTAYFDQSAYGNGSGSGASMGVGVESMGQQKSFEGANWFQVDENMYEYAVPRDAAFPNNLRFGCDVNTSNNNSFAPTNSHQQQYDSLANFNGANVPHNDGGKTNNMTTVYFTPERLENSSNFQGSSNNQPSDSFQDAFHMIYSDQFESNNRNTSDSQRSRDSVNMRSDTILAHMSSFEDSMILDSTSLDHLTSTIADIFNSEGMAGISALLPNLNLTTGDDLLMSPTDDNGSGMLTSPSAYLNNAETSQRHTTCTTQRSSSPQPLSKATEGTHRGAPIHLPSVKISEGVAVNFDAAGKQQRDEKMTTTVEKEMARQDSMVERPHYVPAGSKRMVKCPHCDISLRSRSLKEHVRRKHSTEKVLVDCPVCAQKFSGKTEMKRHQEAKHKNEPKPPPKETFPCLVCQESFTTKEELSQHVLSSHLAPPTVEEVRPVVTVASITSSALVTDVVSQSGNPKKCPYCEKMFKKPSDLIRHVRVHTGEKPYSCHICSKAFRTKSTRNYHIKTHTSEGPMFSCPVCSISFAAKGSLKVHIRIHTNERPLACPHCPETFRTSGKKQQHIKQHLINGDISEEEILARQNKQLNKLLDDGNAAEKPQTSGSEQTEPSAAGQSGSDYARISLQFIQCPVGLQLVCRPYYKSVAAEDEADRSQIILEVSVLEGLAEKGFSITIPVRMSKYGADGTDDGELSSVELDPKMLLESACMITTDTVDAEESEPVRQSEEVGQHKVSPTVASGSGNRRRSTSFGVDVTLNTPHPDGNSNVSHLFSPTDFIDITEGVWAETQVVNSSSQEGEGKSAVFITECLVCGGKFDNAKESANHFSSLEHVERLQQERLRDALSGPKLKLHRCQVCGKEFNRPSHLQRHMAVHSKDKPFKCSDCGAEFSQKSSLTTHQTEGFCAAVSGTKPGFRPYRRKSDLDQQMVEIFTDL